MRRSRLVRFTPEWSASTARLGHLNDEIMHDGVLGRADRAVVADGVELDLDSRPIEDAPFRRDVLDTVRTAIAVVNHQQLARHSHQRLTASEQRVRRTRSLIREAQAALRKRYPHATIAQAAPRPEPNTIVLRADRDGRVA